MGAIPGSKMRLLEDQTGGVITVSHTGWQLTTYRQKANRINPTAFVFISTHTCEDAAYADLREQHWKWVSQTVFERQGWKCSHCGKRLPLQGHHKISKAQWRRGKDGPLDHEDNVEGDCATCHEEQHKKKKGLKTL
jgi:5-methylcytosine-specific restriction endonuclease McrA